MKKLLTVFLLLLTTVAASAAPVITGFEAGYLLDAEEEYFTGHLGLDLRGSDFRSHQLELEIGYTEAQPTLTTEADLMPFTANYRFVARGPGRLGWHAGIGAGVARTRIDGVSTVGPVRLRDTSFAAQAFLGLNYQAGPSTTVTLGAKYIWVDDIKVAGTPVEVGDDVALSAGFSFRF